MTECARGVPSSVGSGGTMPPPTESMTWLDAQLEDVLRVGRGGKVEEEEERWTTDQYGRPQKVREPTAKQWSTEVQRQIGDSFRQRALEQQRAMQQVLGQQGPPPDWKAPPPLEAFNCPMCRSFESVQKYGRQRKATTYQCRSCKNTYTEEVVRSWK